MKPTFRVYAVPGRHILFLDRDNMLHPGRWAACDALHTPKPDGEEVLDCQYYRDAVMHGDLSETAPSQATESDAATAPTA